MKNCSIFLAIILIIATFNFQGSVVFSAGARTNFALKKPVTASGLTAAGSESLNAGKPGVNAVDGDTGTEFETYASVVEGYVQVDLQDEIMVSEVIIRQAAASRLVKYKIEYSLDGINYYSAVDTSRASNPIIINTFEPVRARFVKYNVLSVTPNGGYFGFGVREFEIYGIEAGFEGGRYTSGILDVSVDDNSYKQIRLTAELGLIPYEDEGLFEADSMMTRADFVTSVVKMSGIATIEKNMSGKTVFKDVPPEHWACGYINTAAAAGIIESNQILNFRPDELITYTDAVRMLIYALGYRIEVESIGNDFGFYSVANKLGLLGGGGDNTIVTKKTAANLLYTALKTDIMSVEVFGEKQQFNVIKGVNPLSKSFNMFESEGRVTSIAGTGISELNNISEKFIKIDNKLFDVDGQSMTDFLGKNIIYFYIDEGNNDVPKLFLPIINNKNDYVIKIMSDSIDASSDKNQLIYWNDKNKDKRASRISVKNTANIIYNGLYDGKAHTKDDDIFSLQSGWVEVIDIGSTGEADIVIIYSFDTYVVDTINSADGIINDKYSKGSLDVSESIGKKVTMKMGERKVKPFILKEWDILSVAKSRDDSIMNIYVSNKKIAGIVNEVSSKHDTVTINGTEYEISKDYVSGRIISANDSAVFCFDIFDKITAIDWSSTGGQKYAYLIDAAVLDGIEATAQFKIFTYKGELSIINGADKIELDGIMYKSGTAIKNLNGDNGKIEGQLITYELNGKGEINRLYTEMSKNYEEVSAPLVKNAELIGAKYKSRNRIFASQYSIDKDTLVFLIPPDGKDENYKISNISYFSNDSTYDIAVYDADEIRLSKAVVTSYKSAIVEETAPMLIERVTTAVNEEGERIQKVYGMCANRMIERAGANSDTLEGLEAGDVIQFSVNQAGNIDFYKLMFKHRDKTVAANSGNMSYVFDYVSYKKSTSILTGSDNSIRLYQLEGVPMYRYDKDKKKALSATMDDITITGTCRIFMPQRYDEPRVVVIYED